MLCIKQQLRGLMTDQLRPTLESLLPSRGGTTSTPQTSGNQGTGRPPSWAAMSGAWKRWVSLTTSLGTSLPGPPPSTPPRRSADSALRRSTTSCGQRRGPLWTKEMNFLDTASTVGNTFWPRLRKFTYICVIMLIFLLALSFHVLILKLKFKNILIPIMY